MNSDDLMIRRCIVLASALVYWGGVWVQARRVRRHIGRSPNVMPHGTKERLLWAGWMLVVLGWIATPLLVKPEASFTILRLQSALAQPAGLVLGLALVLGGYAGTLWCYAAMGDRWRMGIDAREKGTLVTRGPYRVVRHPIYLFQMGMLAGAAALLPAWLPVIVLAVHLTCVRVKALDEEAFLTRVHGDDYRNYVSRTGRLFPAFLRRPDGD